jgi:hypothetical protein
MRNDPRVRKGDRLLILFGAALAIALVLRMTGLI